MASVEHEPYQGSFISGQAVESMPSGTATQSPRSCFYSLHWDPTEPEATRPLVLIRPEDNGQNWYEYTHTLNKNIANLTDKTGFIVAHYDYDAYGNQTEQTGPLAEENPIRFSSEYFDEELGLIYYNYRHYNPKDGRWISRELLGELASYNLYKTEINNPINYRDFLGLNVYAIDGTNYNVVKHPSQYSNVYDFYKRAQSAGEKSRYYGGPASDDIKENLADATGLSGPGMKEIFNNVKKDICSDYCKNNSMAVNLVGWSRGAVLAQEIARSLATDGCCCNGVSHKNIRVNFLGMYDAVKMSTFSAEENVPSNVNNYYHAIHTSLSPMFPIFKSNHSNEVEFKNNDGTESSHGDIGTGGTKNNAHIEIITRAKLAGVMI